MGAIVFRGSEFVGSLGETTGYKSGLALREDELHSIVAEGGYDEVWPTEPDQWLRIRAEELEEIFAWIVRRLGVGPAERVVSPITYVYRRVQDEPSSAAAFEPLATEFTGFLNRVIDDPEARSIDPRSFVEWALRHHGRPGAKVALMLVEALAANQLQSPFTAMRRAEWVDVRQLDELFASERLRSPHGEYFDERFANFLAVNFERVDTIHWRQFEGLTAEFFRKAGFAVDLGPGRNDNGVDIRLRPADAAPDGPAVILVQCKRQRTKIEKTVVKALYTDVEHEGAAAGIVVTTSSFAPGTRTMRTARGYPIMEADRAHVRGFVEQLRTPGTGTFLSG